MKVRLFVAFALVVVMVGCNSNPKQKSLTQKEAAAQNWNHARAAVLASLAKSQFEAGNFDQCRQTVNEALRLQPDSALLHVLSAKLQLEQGLLDSADRELALARQLDPKNAESEYLAGVICQRWQKNPQAYEFYTRAAEKNPGELAYVLARAESLVAMSRSREGLQILQSKLEFFENNPLMRHAIGQLQVDVGDYAAAVESLRQASILAPDDASIREHMAMAMFYNRQYREAGDLFARLIRIDANTKRPELWVALGECQMQTNRAGEARASFDTATQLDPGSTAAWLSLAKAALQLGDMRRAEIVLRKVMAIDPNLSEAHLMLGYLRLRQDKLDEALTEFQKASVLDPRDSVSLCMVGYVHEKNGKPKHAMKCYAQALKLKPGDELATRLMASVDVTE